MTDDRQEAAHQAMVWAHRAEAAANDLDSGHTALQRAITHPTVSERDHLARGAERAIKRAEQIRANAIEVANMWAAVASAQPDVARDAFSVRTELVGEETAAADESLPACNWVTTGVCMFNRQLCSPTCHFDDTGSSD